MIKSYSQSRHEQFLRFSTEDLIKTYKDCKSGLERSIKNNDSGGIASYEIAVSDLESELGERGIKL